MIEEDEVSKTHERSISRVEKMRVIGLVMKR